MRRAMPIAPPVPVKNGIIGHLFLDLS